MSDNFGMNNNPGENPAVSAKSSSTGTANSVLKNMQNAKAAQNYNKQLVMSAPKLTAQQQQVLFEQYKSQPQQPVATTQQASAPVQQTFEQPQAQQAVTPSVQSPVQQPVQQTFEQAPLHPVMPTPAAPVFEPVQPAYGPNAGMMRSYNPSVSTGNPYVSPSMDTDFDDISKNLSSNINQSLNVSIKGGVISNVTPVVENHYTPHVSPEPLKPSMPVMPGVIAPQQNMQTVQQSMQQQMQQNIPPVQQNMQQNNMAAGNQNNYGQNYNNTANNNNSYNNQSSPYKNAIPKGVDTEPVDKEQLNTKDKIIISTLIIASLLCIFIIAFLWITKGNNVSKDKTDTSKSEVIQEVKNDKEIIEENDGNEKAIKKNATKSDDDTIKDLTYEGIDKDNVSMIFGGDVLLSQSMINSYNKNKADITNILSKDIVDMFVKSDIAMVNEEFPFSTRGEQMQDKQYTFKAPPEYAKVFNQMGVDIVSLANNHILDFGTDALIDTFSTLNEYNLMYVGAGNNLTEAKETKYIKVNDLNVAFLCASRVIPVSSWGATGTTPGVFTTYDPTALIQEIKKAESEADVSVVYVHWGVEHEEMPQDYQINLAKKYIDAGADVVIGCHTHCLQGMELYNGKPIVYSMGNFMFGGNIDQTMILKVDIDKDKNVKASIKPCYSAGYCTKLVTDSSKIQQFYDYYKGISFGIDIDENGNILAQ
ncbi:MAG: CapA family protein [Lachnospiraceae bacterium]|nr:CapA family protein [Lachnospiraceae bacterium]